MNSIVHVDWVAQKYAWYRAAWIEAAELLDHVGWKWWKHQTVDREQLVLELVDIWHFALSDFIQHHLSEKATRNTSETLAQCAKLIAGYLKEAETQTFSTAKDLLADEQLRLEVERFAHHCLHAKEVNIPALLSLFKAASLDFDELFRKYIGKNVLNRFRQDHGYKDGSYIKVWGALGEDNEVLAGLVSSLDSTKPDFSGQVYEGLSKHYPESN